MGRKSVRQKRLLQIILDYGGIPPTPYLAKELKVSDRTIRNDLNDIDKLIPKVAIDDIEQKLMFRLRDRLPEMSDLNLIRLTGFFVAKKLETKLETEGALQFKIVVVDETEDRNPPMETPPETERSP